MCFLSRGVNVIYMGCQRNVFQTIKQGQYRGKEGKGYWEKFNETSGGVNVIYSRC